MIKLIDDRNNKFVTGGARGDGCSAFVNMHGIYKRAMPLLCYETALYRCLSYNSAGSPGKLNVWGWSICSSLMALCSSPMIFERGKIFGPLCIDGPELC